MSHIPGLDYKAAMKVNDRIYPIATRPYKIQPGIHFKIIFIGFIKTPKAQLHVENHSYVEKVEACS